MVLRGMTRASVVLFLVLGISAASRAALIVSEPVPGEFVVLDEDTDLMWVRNANLAGTKMDWYAALAWADVLDYAGYDDWRLPVTPGTYRGVTDEGEMGHLYYDEGITWSSSSPFTNLQSEHYWTNTVYAPYPKDAWAFNFYYGTQENGFWTSQNRVWAVRDAVAVPEPSSLVLLVSGVAGLIRFRKLKK